MTETIATMAEDVPPRRGRRTGISHLVRDVAVASALSWPQAIAGELPTSRFRDLTEPMALTTDKTLWIDSDPASLAVLDDVESRSSVQSRWIRDLEKICSETASRDWDGEGAAPVQQRARKYAVKLVSELAQGVRFPEVDIDPDGELSLSWRVHDEVFSVSLNSEGRLSYAGLFGASECYGTEWMVEQVPAEVLRQLDRLIFSRRTPSSAD